ncbi:MAG: pilus assembly protein [Chloroflexi bacterium]|nr:pilus assembly protein [Chloroflexota bacterium]
MNGRSKHRRPARGRSAGQALVEFALIFPVFILLIVAAIDIGRGVFAYNSITNGAREGARLAIVNQDATLIAQRAKAQTSVAEVADPSVTVTFKKPTPNADPALNANCTSIAVGCVAIVRFESTYQPSTPIIRNILFPAGVTFVATSIEAVEFTCPNPSTVASACPRQP